MYRSLPAAACLFLNSRCLGVLGDWTEEAYRICIYDMDSGSSVSSQLHYTLPADVESRIQASIIGDRLYLLVGEVDHLSICHFAMQGLISGVNPPNAMMVGAFTETQIHRCFQNLGLHSRGVMAVSVSFNGPGMIIHFWPTSSTSTLNHQLTFTNAVETTLSEPAISNRNGVETLVKAFVPMI
ncbi:hypothetical protein JAAARDRAFT_81382 [Jaapia argillacea MUCL 33604]|uniref:Cleavage/polyadenylation specificity factor A subunit N-terminal domain-containing protein n=1 Tax=Jaapia argillacea MUCL 33604 TaxID=933084 RepID=A0A067PKK6_9AGAM|nr:hypothetical protein JAAARDRAFT_81382 [Jaapia argillacea MUCL 33604]